MVGVCSLRAEESQGLPCRTDPDELVSWVSGLETVTVFATYASVGLEILQRARRRLARVEPDGRGQGAPDQW